MSIKEFSIQKEYEKNPDISPNDIAKLREWLNTQPHLPGEHLSDQDLMIVFYCCEKSAEVSKQVLDLHYSLRTLFTTYFKNRRLDKKTDLCFDTVLYATLPEPTVHGYKALYARLLNPDPCFFNFNDTVRCFMMVFDLCQRQEGTWPGFSLIIDMDTATMGHVAKVEIMTIRQVLYFVQECMLVKLKEVHFINAPYFMDKVMMLLKPWMKQSLMDIMHIHQRGSQDLYNYVPKCTFPKEEGGEYKDHETIRDELLDRLKSNIDFFQEESKRRVKESLRPGGNTTNVEDLLGIQGSFKKLDID